MSGINVQDEKGTIHNFPDGSTPEMIARVMGVKPPGDPLTQQTQSAAKAAGAPMTPTYLAQPSAVSKPPGSADIEKFGQQHEAKQEQLGRAENRAMRSPMPFTNAVSMYAPASSALAIAGGKAGGYTGGKYFGDTGKLVGGAVGSVIGGAGPSMAETVGGLKAPQTLRLPWGFELPLKAPNPYEEMGSSAQYQSMAKEAMKPSKPPIDPFNEKLPLPQRAYAEMQSDLQNSQQAQAASREKMFNDLADARMRRAVQQQQLDDVATRAGQVRMRLERQAQEQRGSVMNSELEHSRNMEKMQVEAADMNRQKNEEFEQQQISKLDKGTQDAWNERQQQLSDRGRLNDQWGSSLNRRGATTEGQPNAVQNVLRGNPTPFGESDVEVLPEPRKALPWDRPGSKWSIERKDSPDLVNAALRGEPGAGEVLQNVGKKRVIYRPRGF